MLKNLLVLFATFCTISISAQNNVWKNISTYDAMALLNNNEIFSSSFKPAEYQLFVLNEAIFKAALQKAGSHQVQDISKSSIIITLPVSATQTENFRIASAPVMQPALSKKYASIISFAGQSIHDPAKTMRCVYTTKGFYASIMTAGKKTQYISTVDQKHALYVLHDRNAENKEDDFFLCETPLAQNITYRTTANKTAPQGNVDDGKLREYQLALCVTGEFGKFHLSGNENTYFDSLQSVMSALVVYLSRLNMMYERDFGIRLILVENEDTLIFFNPSTDPFSYFNMNNACQKTCDNRIGNENYNVGHVLHKGSDNGNAGCIGCVCKTGSKGSGMTTYHDPTLLDYFVVDYWAHELGHQFGANHTFTHNGEGTLAQIEPGSGSSIMGYAGITGKTDVQDHSDDFFSCASIAQVSAYIKSAKGECAQNILTFNQTPVVNAGKDRIIPHSTPFTLSGVASDIDKTDFLTYNWEQIDVKQTGSSAIPKSTNTAGPAFRSINYSASLIRSFPDNVTVLSGTLFNEWEVLPEVSRDLNFRFTARDNHAGGGSNISDDMLVQVTDKAGPFQTCKPQYKRRYNKSRDRCISKMGCGKYTS